MRQYCNSISLKAILLLTARFIVGSEADDGSFWTRLIARRILKMSGVWRRSTWRKRYGGLRVGKRAVARPDAGRGGGVFGRAVVYRRRRRRRWRFAVVVAV